MICDVCGIEYEEYESDIIDLCEECSMALETEVDFIRDNIDSSFGF